MLLKQISFFIATYFLREKMSRPPTNWISDSTKAITYTAITSMFITKFSSLLKKSVIVIPLVVFGTVLSVLCYLDLMDVVDNGVKQFAPSFVINLIVTVVSFSAAIYVLKSSSETDPAGVEVSNTDVVLDPLQNAGTQIQENISFFKRGFAQGFEKPTFIEKSND